MIYEFQCILCNEHFELFQRMNDTHKAFHCGIEAQRIWTIPATDRDQAYSFVAESFGSPVQINSKGQYRKLIKQHGFMDASPREVKQHAAYRKRTNEEGYARERKKTAESIFVKNREKIRSGYGRR